jgi:hypothetical protein
MFALDEEPATISERVSETLEYPVPCAGHDTHLG